jgi:hypothetical protein
MINLLDIEKLDTFTFLVTAVAILVNSSSFILYKIFSSHGREKIVQYTKEVNKATMF